MKVMEITYTRREGDAQKKDAAKKAAGKNARTAKPSTNHDEN